MINKLNLMMATTVFTMAVSQAAITYLDATTGNTTESDGTPFTPTTSNVADQWKTRAFANGGTIYEANGTAAENAPALATTIGGLTSGTQYNLYAYFWAPTNTENWRLKASLTPAIGMSTNPSVSFPNDISVSFSKSGSPSSANSPALATGVDGSDNLGVAVDGSGNATGGYFTNTVLIQEADRNLYQVSLGTATASGGSITIYIDDLENTATSQRTWYDGVGFATVPEPSSTALFGLGGLALILRRRR